MADKHWYIVQAYSNFERKVADSIREQAKQRHLDHLFEEVMVFRPIRISSARSPIRFASRPSSATSTTCSRR